jgi:hypothetical protein
VKKIAKLYVVDIQIGSFFLPALLARVFSIRIPLFGKTELYLPTPVSHPPSQGRYLYILLPQNTFASIKK